MEFRWPRAVKHESKKVTLGEMKHKFSPDDGMKRDMSIIQITCDDVKRKKEKHDGKQLRSLALTADALLTGRRAVRGGA